MTSAEILGKLAHFKTHSELVKVAASIAGDGGIRYVLGEVILRALYRDEVLRLEEQGNSCGDWSRVRVVQDFDGRKVQHSTFLGDIVLGRTSKLGCSLRASVTGSDE